MTGPLAATAAVSGDVLVALVLVVALLLGAVLGWLLARRGERRPRPRCVCTTAECKDAWHGAQGPCCDRCSGHRGER